MDVSIIIVNYNSTPLLLNCLNSIYKETKDVSFEVIALDNNSDKDFETKVNVQYPQVKCVSLTSNLGFGLANNEGIKLAKGRNILLLNPDTILLNNAVKILSDYLDVHSNVGACGGNLYDEDLKPTHSYFMILPSLMWELDIYFRGLIHHMFWGKNAQFNHNKFPRKVGYICGADLMIKRSVLDKVGCFSPLFFLYYEETELICRIKRAGYSIYSVPDAKVQHLEGKSMGGKRINVSRLLYMERSLTVYYSLHANRIENYIIQRMRLFRLAIKHYVLSCEIYSKELYLKERDLILGKF